MSAYLPWLTDAVEDYFASISLKAMLLKSTYTYDPTHDFRSDVSAHETSGAGYTAGGIAVTGVAITQDNVNALVKLDFNDLAFGTLNVAAFVAVAVYVNTGSSATDALLGIDIFGSTLTDGSDTFTYIVGDNGFIALEV